MLIGISILTPLHENFLKFDWLRAVVFQLNLKYLHVKIANPSYTYNICFAYLHRNCGASNYQKTSMYKVIFFLLIFTCLSITNKILRTRLHKSQPFFVGQSI